MPAGVTQAGADGLRPLRWVAGDIRTRAQVRATTWSSGTTFSGDALSKQGVGIPPVAQKPQTCGQGAHRGIVPLGQRLRQQGLGQRPVDSVTPASSCTLFAESGA